MVFSIAMLVYQRVVPIVDGTSPLCQSTGFVGTVTWGAACNSWPNYFQCWPLSTVRSSPIPTVVYTQYHGKVCLVALGLPESMNKHLFGLEWRSYGHIQICDRSNYQLHFLWGFQSAHKCAGLTLCCPSIHWCILIFPLEIAIVWSI